MLKFDDFKYNKDAAELPMAQIFEKLVTPFNDYSDAYVTLDNGGEPFTVIYDDKKKVAKVYKNEERLEVKKIFDGVEKGKGDRGTSLLLQIEKNKYVYVGSTMYEFTTDDEIVEFYSVIGNSAVPYPVAVGKENAYFMIEYKYVPIEDFKEGIDWAKDGYGYFYGWLSQDEKGSVSDKDRKPMKSYKMKDYKEILKRNI